MTAAIAHYLLALLVAPLLPGIINRVKAKFAGRAGKPLLQAYFDIAKLLRKGAVYSRTTTWIFKAGPTINLAAMLVALLFLPFGASPAVAAFSGDLFLFVYCLGLARFLVVTAALDTGSSFEGMGASREAAFSALAEPMLFLGLLVLARQTGGLSLSHILGAISAQTWLQAAPTLALATGCLFILALVENSRIPVDDPNTHLELTMIHEVMVLDHSGPDLGFIHYAATLKMWLFLALIANLLAPTFPDAPASAVLNPAVMLLTTLVLAAAVGVVESVMARLRMMKVPQLIAMAGAFSALALILYLR